MQCVPGEYEGQHCPSEEPHKPPEIATCHSGPAALEPGWEHDRCDGFQSQLWSITLPMVGDLRDAFP